MEQWTSSVCYCHPLRLSGCMGQPVWAWVSEDCFGNWAEVLWSERTWEHPPARILVTGAEISKRPLPLGGISTRHVFQFPGFPWGMTLQLPTGVAAAAGAPCRLPLLGVTFPHLPGSQNQPNTPTPFSPCLKVCVWENRSEIPAAAAKMAQGLKVGPASSWLCHMSHDSNPSQFRFS